jgi:hypothetical protein
MILIEVIAGLLFVATSGLLFNERFRRNRYLVIAAAILALISTYFLFEQVVSRAIKERLESETAEQSAPSPDTTNSAPPRVKSGSVQPEPGEPEAPPPPDPSRIVVSFDAVRTNYPPDYMVAAAPTLHSAPIPIDIVRVTPDTARIVLRNNMGLYDGRALQPTLSQNFLSQVNVDRNAPSSFRLRFAEPVEGVTFVIPAIFPASESGVTFPAWRATAYTPNGRAVSTVSEALARRFANASAQTYTLRAPDFEGIQEVEFVSDWRLDGIPFAGFEAILIEQVELHRRSN